jgi:hypothetical protein
VPGLLHALQTVAAAVAPVTAADGVLVVAVLLVGLAVAAGVLRACTRLPPTAGAAAPPTHATRHRTPVAASRAVPARLLLSTFRC